jgi:hypothetical protein
MMLCTNKGKLANERKKWHVETFEAQREEYFVAVSM